MNKLITAYQANPNLTTAGKVLDYITKHPMAMCFATPEQQAVVNQVLTGARA
jgi:hypothetical protein